MGQMAVRLRVFTRVVRIVGKAAAVAAVVRLVPTSVVRLVTATTVATTAVVRTPAAVTRTILTTVGPVGSSLWIDTWSHSVAGKVEVDETTRPPQEGLKKINQ